MHIRPLLLLAPVVLAGTVFLATPQVARANNGMTETGTTSYEVIPSKNAVQVTIQISIHNETPNQATSTGYTYYYWNSTAISVEASAGAISATSDAGGVTASTVSSNDYYRVVKLSYPNVYYGQTRVVTASYSIPAAPHATSIFRASQAYASLCAGGSGADKGSVSVIVPDGFNVSLDSGDPLTKTDDSGGKQTFSSGAITSPRDFWTCIDAEDPTKLTHAPLTASGQAFDIEGWPEDKTWSAAVSADVSADVGRLEDLTGLKMPGGTIVILEAGDEQLGLYGGTYNSATTTAAIPETARRDVVAHELSHIWFNRSMFVDTWLSEGLAGYSEQAAGEGNYTPCADPGAYPGAGLPNLMTWQKLNFNSTTQDQNVSDWQYSASCYFITVVADAMGAADFKNVLTAAAADEMAYIGATPGERLVGSKLPLTSEQMLDLIDERGMVPAGVTDFDQAQKLLGNYGVFDAATLSARSRARSAYHELEAKGGTWKLPLAIRTPMSTWDFATAQTAMTTAGEILDVRDSIQTQIAGFSLDGTTIRRQFESATSQSDLDSLLTLIKKESEAATNLAAATKLNGQSRNILQSLGLLGTDVDATLKQAQTDLQNVKPDAAGSEAQSVTDRLNGAANGGLLRLGAVFGLLALLVLVVAMIVVVRRRRPAPGAMGPGGPGYVVPPGGPWAPYGQPVAPYEDLSPLLGDPPAVAPATEAPAIEPTATEPTATEPTATEPTATEPTATEAPAIEPTATEPTAIEPTATEPTATPPASPGPDAAIPGV